MECTGRRRGSCGVRGVVREYGRHGEISLMRRTFVAIDESSIKSMLLSVDRVLGRGIRGEA
jgi:hypothetical protein